MPSAGLPMRALLALSAVAVLLFVAAPVSANAGGDAVMCNGCDAIIALCQKLLHFTCVEASTDSAASVDCMGLPCDLINRFCHCLG